MGIWARGRWSTSGDGQRFQFDFPNYSISPVAAFAYAEVKAVLTPRFMRRSAWEITETAGALM
jgi:hypothetical protein